jgi:hypothetical protein
METIGLIASIGTLAHLGRVVIKTGHVLVSVASDNEEIGNQIRCAGGQLDTGGTAIKLAFKALKDRSKQIDQSAACRQLAKSRTFDAINNIAKYLYPRIKNFNSVKRLSSGLPFGFRETFRWVWKDKAMVDDILFNIKALQSTLQIILAVVQIELNAPLLNQTENTELRKYVAQEE